MNIDIDKTYRKRRKRINSFSRKSGKKSMNLSNIKISNSGYQNLKPSTGLNFKTEGDDKTVLSNFFTKEDSILSFRSRNRVDSSRSIFKNVANSDIFLSNYEMNGFDLFAKTRESVKKKVFHGEVELKKSKHDYCFRLDDIFLFRLPKSRKQKIEHNLFFDKIKSSIKKYQKNGLLKTKKRSEAVKNKGAGRKKKKCQKIEQMKIQLIDKFQYREMKIALDKNYSIEAERSRIGKSLQRQFFEIDFRSISELVKIQEDRQDWKTTIKDLQNGRRHVHLKKTHYKITKNKPKSRYVAYTKKDDCSVLDTKKFKKPSRNKINLFKKPNRMIQEKKNQRLSLTKKLKIEDRSTPSKIKNAKPGKKAERSRGKNKFLIPRESVEQISNLEGLYIFKSKLENYNTPSKECLSRYSNSSKRTLGSDFDNLSQGKKSNRFSTGEKNFDVIQEVKEEKERVEGIEIMTKSMKNFRKRLDFEIKANLTTEDFSELALNPNKLIVDEQDEKEENEKYSFQSKLRRQNSPDWISKLSKNKQEQNSKFKRREKATEIESPLIQKFEVENFMVKKSYDRDEFKVILSQELKMKEDKEVIHHKTKYEIEGKKREIADQLLGIFEKCEQIDRSDSKDKIEINYDEIFQNSKEKKNNFENQELLRKSINTEKIRAEKDSNKFE